MIWPSPQQSAFEQAASCQPCHSSIYESYTATAHFKTSRPADRQSILGKFSEGRNLLKTRERNTYFRMEERADGFYQTGYSGAAARTERFDLVFGSGRKGQTYLYWKNNLLFQLPVSYVTGTDTWVNSPAYVDGRVNFDRLIPPRCLECHTTYFKLEGPLLKLKYAGDYLLGISCEKCHGPSAQHAEYHTSHPDEHSARYILNPKKFSRDRKIDNCALCHSGIRQPTQLSFAYRPGEALADYFLPESDRDHPAPDVHGNQVGLLRKSKCFAASPDMSCSSCHDVHKEERELSALSRKCMQCHQPSTCGIFRKAGPLVAENCIDCHMPSQKSNVITISTGTGRFSPHYRNHAIGIYPAESAKALRQFQETRK